MPSGRYANLRDRAAAPRPLRQLLAARGESLALHRDGRGAPVARRDDREPGPPPRVFCAVGCQYREYLSEEQRSQRPGSPPRVFQRGAVERGCIAGRMQPDFHHGLLKADTTEIVSQATTPRVG